MPRKKKEEIEEIKKPKALGPYDIIKMMFTDNDSFEKLSPLMLERNFFMINRIMSIKYPFQAQCFNQTEIRKDQVIKAWQQFAVSKLGYGKVPSFVYTKGAKASQQAENIDEISKETKEAYCKHYNISLTDFNDLLFFAHDMTIEHVKQFEKVNSTSEQNKMISKIK